MASEAWLVEVAEDWIVERDKRGAKEFVDAWSTIKSDDEW